MIAADDREQLRPGGLLEDRVLPLLRLSGSLDDQGVEIDLAAIVEGKEQPLPELAAPAGLADLPRLDACYEVGFGPMPVLVEDTDDEAWVVAAVDPESGMARIVEVLAGRNLAAAAAALFAGLQGEGRFAVAGLPRRIAFTNEALSLALRPALGRLGVECAFEPELPAVDDLFADLDRWVADEDETEEPDHGEELRRWKAADLNLSERIGQMAGVQALESAKARRRYFGRDLDVTQLRPGGRTEMMVICYIQWFAFDHRAKPRSKTIAERVLDLDLSDPERAVLQARLECRPSLYQVREIDPDDSLVLADALTGREVLVHDRGLSRSATVGVALFAWVYPAGPFHFLGLASPPLPPVLLERALEFLEEECGLDLDGPVPAAASHLLGHLWDWQLDSLGTLPERLRLTNTDGEPLLGHEVWFEVEDPASLSAALERRDDVVTDEPGASWSWQRGDLHLGRLELFDDELMLDVNSAERCDRARAWLERIPGVRFVSVEQIELDPRKAPRASVPLDDRLQGKPFELDAEGLAELQRIVDEKCLEWLDERIPALGDMTPREACTTESGRKKVARMIRTYPDPAGTPGLTVPRDEMLRRLGLGEEGAAGG